MEDLDDIQCNDDGSNNIERDMVFQYDERYYGTDFNRKS